MCLIIRSHQGKSCVLNYPFVPLKEKKKYEISTGNHKTADDLIVMYTDFVERYPVIGIIDGISFKVWATFARVYLGVVV